MLWSVDSCQNRVSADQYCKTVSWAEVSTHWGWVFLFCNYLLTSYILLVFKWSQAQVLFLFFSLIFIFSRFLFLSFGLRHFKWEAQIYPGHPVAYHLTFWNSQCKLVHVLQCNLYRGRASDISRGRGPAKFRYFREIPRNPPEIFPNTCRQNIFNTYLGY